MKNNEVRLGMRVRHRRWGWGTVVDLHRYSYSFVTVKWDREPEPRSAAVRMLRLISRGIYLSQVLEAWIDYRMTH